MYCPATTVTTHSKKPNRRNFRVWNSHGPQGHSRYHGYYRRGIFGGLVLWLCRMS